MKILRLTAENVKRLKVVDITPEPGLNQVTGKNGNGKSSVLDSIWWAIGGKKQIQAVPIRKGAESARIRLDLGELIVERTFTAAGTTTLTVRNAVGAAAGTPDKKLPAFQSPQDILDALVGSLSFDPLAFANSKEKDQYDELQAIAHLEIIEELDAANEADYKRRAEANKDVKSKQAQAAAITYAEKLPDDPIDERALLTEMEKAAAFNADLEARTGRRQQARKEVDDLRAKSAEQHELALAERSRAEQRILTLERELEEFRKIAFADAEHIETLSSNAAGLADKLDKKLADAEPLPSPIDIKELRGKVDDARVVNAEIGRRAEKQKLSQDIVEMQAYVKALNDTMEAREKQKREAIAAAKMPVDGLSLETGRVLFNGLPFDQASDAERLRTSVAVAMAANPKLRVIRIKNGSLLDEDGIRILSEMAGANDYQVWLERVDSSGQIGIVMENGEVKPAKEEK